MPGGGVYAPDGLRELKTAVRLKVKIDAAVAATPHQTQGDEMYIKRLHIENIKGFDHVDLNFEKPNGDFAGWCVITGDNGSGKTTLLKCIALATLGSDQSRDLVQDLSGWPAAGKGAGTISTEIVPDHDVDKTAKGGYPNRSFWAEVQIEDGPIEATISATDIFTNKKKGGSNGPWDRATTGWLCLGYGPFRRLYGSSPDAQRLMVLPGRAPHFATLFKEDATLGEGENWIRDLNYRKLEGDRHSEKVLTTLLDFIGNDFLRQGFEIEGVTSAGMSLRDNRKRIIKIEDMSEGYRASLAMLIDIFRHMVDCYDVDGLVETDDATGQLTVMKPGVVLIDEADAHLHPAWQQTLGDWLRDHFPRVQFIVTTHSPMVCQAADGGRVYVTPSTPHEPPYRVEEEEYRVIISGQADDVLTSRAFGLAQTRSPLAVEKRKRYGELKAKKISRRELTDLEEGELTQLQFFVPELP